MLLLLLPTAAAADASDDVFGVSESYKQDRAAAEGCSRAPERQVTAGCTYMYLRGTVAY